MLATTDTLLKGLAQGNQCRWARFYRDYTPYITKFLFELGLSHADADEVVHDTLVALAKQMPEYKYDKAKYGPFHSYVLKIARNKAVDRMRRNAAYAEHLRRFADVLAVASGEIDWRKVSLDIALRRVFANSDIGETARIAFRRHVQLGEDARTVADDLGITVNNLYQIKRRIKEALKVEIEKLRREC